MISADSGIAPAAGALGAHDAPESVLTFARNHCSRYAGIGAHDPPEYALGRQPSKLSRAFPLSASATFTQVLPTTLRIARKWKCILEEQNVAADNLQGQLESNPDYQAEIAELRSRILGRWTAAQESGEATPTA